MRTRRFGKTDWQVSDIGYGAWQIGGNMWGAVSDADAEKALEAALDSGITFFDTALAYGEGHSEQVLGRVLKRTKRRDHVRVATKIPPMDRQWPASPRSPLRDVFPAKWIQQCTAKSIKNLGFEPDLQQLHVWTDSWADDNEWYDTLQELKQRENFRAFGVSVNDHEPESAVGVTRAGRIDSLQVIYNIFDQSPEKELFSAALDNDVGIIVRVPLDEGSLAGKLTLETKFERGDFRAEYFGGDHLKQAVEHVEKLRPVIEKDGQTMAEGALRFCLTNPAVATVIVGSTKPDHVRANADVSDKGALDLGTMSALRSHVWQRNFYP
ncbi:MAG TPA: aldo/keto reductase [Longimicrobiales bacterium]|nr:aldo/keto reductase [Longimicrobiales bacterium]